MALNCPSCKKIDMARKVSAIIKEQTSTGTASTSGLISHPLSLPSSISTTTQSSTQSNLAGNLSEAKSTTRSGVAPIGCGGFLAFAGFGALITGDMTKYDAGQIATTWVLAILGLLVFGIGIAMFRGDKAGYQTRAAEVASFNSRVQSAWYCSRCDVRFDSQGVF